MGVSRLLINDQILFQLTNGQTFITNVQTDFLLTTEMYNFFLLTTEKWV